MKNVLLRYLTEKPVDQFWCPYCRKWHVAKNLTIAETFKENLRDHEEHAEYDKQGLEFWCKSGKVISAPDRLANNFRLFYKDGLVKIGGKADNLYFGPKCMRYDYIEGSINFQDIVSNCVVTMVQDGYIDITFEVDCHPPYICSECEIYKKKYYLCDHYEVELVNNFLYYHEKNVRAHFVINLGFRFKIAEGDFNIVTLRSRVSELQRKIEIEIKEISCFKKMNETLRTYFVEDPIALQTFDNSESELEALLQKVAELKDKVSNMDSKLKWSMVTEELEKEAAKEILDCNEIQLQLNDIKNKKDKIAEKFPKI